MTEAETESLTLRCEELAADLHEAYKAEPEGTEDDHLLELALTHMVSALALLRATTKKYKEQLAEESVSAGPGTESGLGFLQNPIPQNR